MASVWRAEDETLQRPVALKLLFARDDRDKNALVEQFLREARIAAAVQHRNVIQIVDFGKTEEEQPYMVMELLEGESLGERMHEGEPLSLSEIVHVASLTLRGLGAVHEAGIIHRDLKPDNIFLKQDAGNLFPKILDFGISRSVEPSSGRRSALTTREGIIVGTPEYMSPEQARGLKDIDQRSDLYSIGVIMYEALTGELPFASENIGDLIIQIVTGTAPPVHEVRPDVPRGISAVIERSMSRKAADRYPDAGQMQKALLAAAEDSSTDVKRSLSDRPPPLGKSGPIRIPSNRLIAQEPSQSVGSPLQEQEFKLDSAPPPVSLDLDVPAPPAKTHMSTAEIEFAAQAKAPPKALFIVIGLAAVLVIALFAGALDSDEDEAPTQVVQQEVAPPPPPEPELQMIHLRNVPAEATIRVDGTSVPGASFEVPKDGEERTIEVSAPGKESWTTRHSATSPDRFDVVLVEVEPAKPAARKRPLRRPLGKKKKSRPLRDLDF